MKKKRLALSTTHYIMISFLLVILAGSVLLSLPISTVDGKAVSYDDALFTATTATCVTGLVMYDTFTQWSGFGQAVIICLIQIGGLGFMSIATMVVFLLRRKVGLKQRLLMAQALSLNDMEGVVQ